MVIVSSLSSSFEAAIYEAVKVKFRDLKGYVSRLMIEGRVDDAREKFPDMEDENFDYLVANQPAGSNNKYLMWTCKQADALLELDPDPQGLSIVVQAVRLFDGNRQRLKQKDLNQYKDVAEIETAVDSLGGASKSQQSKQARAESDVVFNDDQFLVLRPHTTEASCKYGVGTRWCIAATATKNYFTSYSSSNNKFYFVIDKKAETNTPTSKFAIVIKDPVTEESQTSIQVFNASDHQVGLNAVIKHCGDKWSEIWSKILEHTEAQPVTREVEEARKDTEEHVKNLLKGEKVSREGLEKVAKNAALSNDIVSALIKRMQDFSGQRDNDPRDTIIAALADRAAELPSESALELIKYVPSTKPAADSYWYGRYRLETLIRSSPLSPQAFRDLAESADNETMSLILKNPNCPADIIEKVAERLPDLKGTNLKNDIYRALMERGTISAEQFHDAMTDNRNGYGMAYEVIHYPRLSANLPPELLRMVPVKSVGELKAFLDLPNVPPDLVADLITKNWQKFKKKELYELLRNINLPTDMIERLWSDKDQHIRISLLQNPAIGAANATKFASSRNSAYRFAVAHNTALPAESLQALAGDESASTRAAIAGNPNAPAETLRVLAGDEAIVVRANAASNNKTPQNVLNALKRDSDDFVRKSARKTLKSLGVVESFIAMTLSMHGALLTEEMADDDLTTTISPPWNELPTRDVTAAEFVAIYLLQNNGHATREDIEAAYQSWNPQYATTQYRRSRFSRRRGAYSVKAKNVWQIIKNEDYSHDNPAPFRTTNPGGNGWWWSPPGINKGAVFRLTPTGASVAMNVLGAIGRQYPDRQWSIRSKPDVKKSPPPRELNPQAAAGPAAPRGPKTTYKIYGRHRGAPAHTRLKGQAYAAPRDTRFSPGEQAFISGADDGKLSIKKTDSDHTQLWEPVDG